MLTKNFPWGSGLLLALVGLGNLSLLTHEATALTVTSDFDRNATAIPTTVAARDALNNFLGDNANSETVNFGTGAANVTLNPANPAGDATAYTFSQGNLSFSTTADDAIVTGVNDPEARGFNTTGSASTYSGTNGFRLQLLPSNNDTLTLTFAVPVFRFGLIFTDYGNASVDDGFVGFEFRDSSNNIIANSITPFTNLNNGQTGSARRNALFLGFSATGSDLPISTAIITVRNTGVDRFSVDDIRSSTQPIPFEFNPAVGVLLVGGYFAGNRFLRKKKA